MARIKSKLIIKPFAWLMVHIFDCEVYVPAGVNKLGNVYYKKLRFGEEKDGK
jgi:hypothetical protein